jgi:hypothetical protein
MQVGAWLKPPSPVCKRGVDIMWIPSGIMSEPFFPSFIIIFPFFLLFYGGAGLLLAMSA